MTITRCSISLVPGVLGVIPLVAKSDTISTVYASIGPLAGASPSYGGYTTNAQTGVQNGGATTGSSSPTQFSTVNSITWASLNFDTAFNNWNSIANPPAPNNNEFGNAAFFSVVLKAAPGVNSIALDDISYVESSSDPYNFFGFSCSFGDPSCGDTNYAADAVGIMANGSQVSLGTSGTTDVNEIILTGVALGFDVGAAGFSGTDQQQLDQAVSAENGLLGDDTIATCFLVSSDGLSNCGSLNVTPTTSAVPEPASFGLLGIGLLLALVAFRPLRRATKSSKTRVGCQDGTKFVWGEQS